MTASKRPRRDERRKAREQKRGRVHFFALSDTAVTVVTQVFKA